MIRRSVCTISILFFCALVISCGKADYAASSNLLDNKSARKEKVEDTFTREIPEDLDIHIYEEVDTKANPETATNKVLEAEDILMKEHRALAKEAFSQASIPLSGLVSEKDDIRTILRKITAGTILDTTGVDQEVLESLFYAEEISEEVKERINGKSYGEECDVPYSELRYIRVLHTGFDGQTHIGELIVNNDIAMDIIEIFKELYEVSYPVERMVLVDEYEADDNTSMEANNSSAFNYRRIDRSTRLSEHSYGRAIDINPLYNPYVRVINGETVVLPEGGSAYTDRDQECPYYIKEGDPCWAAFVKRGFTWGGDWENHKDYQHFQKGKAE
jgi:hypothetical protein